MEKIAVTCPHCSVTTTQQVSWSSSSNGETPAQCGSCHKTFWLVHQNGSLRSTHK